MERLTGPGQRAVTARARPWHPGMWPQVIEISRRTGRAEAQIWADRDAASLERLATAAERHLDADESAARLLHHITEGERA